MNDWNRHEGGYDPGYGNGRNQAGSQTAGDSLLGSILLLVFRALKIIFLFLPAIFCAYLILNGLRAYTGNLEGWNYAVVMVTLVYGIECLVFFLKGWLIALKGKEEEGLVWAILWVLLWVVCFLYCFTLPIMMIHGIMAAMVGHTHISRGADVIIWLIAGGVGYYAFYLRYDLNRDDAPRWVHWAYRIGRSLR